MSATSAVLCPSHLLPESTGNAQEAVAPSRHDKKCLLGRSALTNQTIMSGSKVIAGSQAIEMTSNVLVVVNVGEYLSKYLCFRSNPIIDV